MNTIASDGRVKIRANDIADSKEITEKLKSMGLEVTPHKEKTAKPKTYYLFLILIFNFLIKRELLICEQLGLEGGQFTN